MAFIKPLQNQFVVWRPAGDTFGGLWACCIGICNQAVENRIIVAGARKCLKSAHGLNSIVKETPMVHATHMQHDTQHEHVYCVFPLKTAFEALSPPPAPFLKNTKNILSAVTKTREILNENARVACRVACTMGVSFTMELSPWADFRHFLAPATIMRFSTA